MVTSPMKPKKRNAKKPVKNPEETKALIEIAQKVDQLKFLTETNKTYLRMQACEIYKRQFKIFRKNPASDSAKAFFNIEFSKAIKAMKENHI